MTTWEKWEPKEEVPSFMYAESIFINSDGLIVCFENKDRTKTITFTFSKQFLSVRETYDGVLMKDLAALYVYCESGKCEHGTLFKSKNSDYMRLFKKHSLGKHDSDDIEHYVILSCDIIYEVLTISAPTIKIENKE